MHRGAEEWQASGTVEALSNNPNSALLATDDDSHVVGKTLTDKQEKFAQAWARTGNKAAAYREAYNVRPTTVPQVVWVNASKVAALPHVEARYRELHDQAVLETVVSIREALQWQLDIATADPNEIVRVVARCCRHCYGKAHAYQWTDDIEFLDAYTKALDERAALEKSGAFDEAARVKIPDDSGGYGFSAALEPVLTCPHCLGVGHEQTIINDTTKLTGKARKLYAGAEQDRFGAIKVKLHDQKAAWEMVCRMLGAFNDKLDLRTSAERAADEAKTKLPDNVTAETAARAYLGLLGGSR